MRSKKIITPVKEPLWYKDAVIYEAHVRSFSDSNGDGIGDLEGVTQKMSYLQDLGITALWLLPFYPSPMKDDGYDIADYYAINPMYGTMADFRKLVREAHRRGIRVITELVLNHTSDQCAWFQKSRRAKAGDKWRDFYVWSDTAERYKDVRIIFKDFEPSNWSWDPVAHAYYWHRFYAHQPDLNFENLELHEEILRVIDFWLDEGVDGFRLDAIPYLYEREGTSCDSLPETHQFLKKLRRHVDDKYGDRLLLAEANQWPEEAVTYFGEGEGDECHMAFHFPLMPRLFMAVRLEDRTPVMDIVEQTPALPPSSQWALFLRNHDELTLEMVTDEERDYMYRVFANDSKARINLGIRRRLAPLLGNDRRKIELLNLLLFSLPGTPVVYYGDEIGMGDNIYLGDRNGVRTPMHWSSDKNAGFSRCSPQALQLPVIVDPEYHYESTNVETQERSSNSLLWWTKRLIGVRKRWKAFGRGSLDFIQTDNRKVLAYVRRFEEETILVVANLSRSPQPVTLDLSAFDGSVPIELFGGTEFPRVRRDPYFFSVGPHSGYWFSLSRKAVPVTRGEGVLPELTVNRSWDELFAEPNRKRLESILIDFIRVQPWFDHAADVLDSIRIVDMLEFGTGREVRAALVSADLRSGESETYFVPMACQAGAPARQVLQTCPESCIARLTGRRGTIEGVLYDATASPEFIRAFLGGPRKRAKGELGDLIATDGEASAKRLIRMGRGRTAKVHSNHSGTTIEVGHAACVRLLRKVEAGTHPAAELPEFLARRGYAHAPRIIEQLAYHKTLGDRTLLGVVTETVRGTNGWDFAGDFLDRYIERVRSWPSDNTALSCLAVLPRSAFEKIPPNVAGIVGGFLEQARLLGQRSAELHIALGSATDDADFAPEPFTPFHFRSLYQSVRHRILEVQRILDKSGRTLSEEEGRLAKEMARARPELLKRLRSLYQTPITAARIRGHGDLRLEKVTHTGKDFVITGFEGDVGRPLSERRLKRSPLNGVARMIWSFYRVADAALERHLQSGRLSQDQAEQSRQWILLWWGWVSSSYLRGYLSQNETAKFIPHQPAALAVLFEPLLFEEVAVDLARRLSNNQEPIAGALYGLINLARLTSP